jgi:uncharacterized membrane protein YeaQ/YmgE (transglycosylase-associated protein family)
MTLESLLYLLIVGLIAGFLAALVMKERGMGFLGYLVVGVIGALLGGWLFGLLKINAGGFIGSLVAAFVGSLILLFLLRQIRR